jgi:hypothetical protein
MHPVFLVLLIPSVGLLLLNAVPGICVATFQSFCGQLAV